MRTTIAEINKDNLVGNYLAIRAYAANSGIIAIIKANAYGHGIIGCAKVLEENGVDFFGVAFPDEGIMLREAGIKTPILVLVQSLTSQAKLYCEYDLQPAISSEEFLKQLSKEAVLQNKTVKAHLFIDTGMSRDGISPEYALEFMKKYKALPNIKIHGICTHFATATSDLDFALMQLQRFNNTVNLLKENGFCFDYIHAANTAGLVNFPDAQFNMVRPGISLYGYYPADEIKEKINLKPIMTLKSKVHIVRRINKDDSVGYDRLFIADKPTTIVVVPIGYGDGYFKTLTGKAECIIRGKKYKIVGNICMDECMVDVGNDLIEVNDEVILIGNQANESITIYELADKIGTIPYEITTSITERVPRVFVNN